MKSMQIVNRVLILAFVLILPLSSRAGQRGTTPIHVSRTPVNPPAEQSNSTRLGTYTLDSLTVDGHPWTTEGYAIHTQQNYHVEIEVTWHASDEGTSPFDAASQMTIDVPGMNLLNGSLLLDSDFTGTLSGYLLYDGQVDPEGPYTALIQRQGTLKDIWQYDLLIQNPLPTKALALEQARDAVSVPVPSALLLVSTGLAGVARLRRRRMV
jgi:hypothetical protein